ncbi:MAG: primosomal protein [Candidatus Parcubacteria bacterium]|jgi:primosomal protein N'
MFVIQVTPLIRGTQLESLSYFSSIDYPIGSFLTIPIRGKSQSGIVTGAKSVSTTKTALKAATFSLRKLPSQPDPIVLPETIRNTAEALTKRYPTSVGVLLFNLLPPDIRNGSQPYPRTTVVKQEEETIPQILTARLDERYLAYQSFIRSTFAHHGSIMIVVPTATEISYAVAKLSQGIEDRVIVFSPHQTKRQRESSYKKIVDDTNSKLIITTPSHAYLERHDLLAIIIEQSASGHYVTRRRPYLDHRDALIALARASGRSILLGDTVPRTEDEVERRQEHYLTYGEEAKRIAFSAPLNIITQKDKPNPEVPFQLFSQELVVSVERALEARGHVFFYAARRGLAPVVACIDCGYIFRCPDSNTPYSLVRTQKNGEEQRWFISSTSGRRIKAADVCTNCGSWRLRERGIGIQYIYDEWQKRMPDCDITVIDSTTAPTAKQASKLADEFFKKRSGVLIGTQTALPFLSQGVDVSAVISLDATRAIPTWRADESLFRLLFRLRECTSKEVILQTRTEVDSLLIHATRGAIERFYDDEIALREMLKYPPYSIFILLTWIGTHESVFELEKPVETILHGHDVQFYNNPNSTRDKTQRHGLIRIPVEDKSTYEIILNKLRTLPRYVKTEINPERIV